MKNIFRLLCVIVTGALVWSAGMASADDLSQVTVVSIQVQPQVAVRSSGGMLSLDVRCEGLAGVGVQFPVSVTGAPEGTTVEVLPQSEHYALVSLVFPPVVAKGRYALNVKVGSPETLAKQTVQVEIGDSHHD